MKVVLRSCLTLAVVSSLAVTLPLALAFVTFFWLDIANVGDPRAFEYTDEAVWADISMWALSSAIVVLTLGLAWKVLNPLGSEWSARGSHLHPHSENAEIDEQLSDSKQNNEQIRAQDQ